MRLRAVCRVPRVRSPVTPDDLQGKAREARARLEGACGDAVDAVNHAGQSLGRTVQANPMITVLVAAAAGYLLGRWAHRD